MSLLDIRGLDISFKHKPVKVVSDVSFSVAESEIFGLAGESGCGKSLSALSILGILPNTFKPTGEIIFKDRNLLDLSNEELRKIRGKDIGMIFQEPLTSLNPVLRVGYQIKEAITAHFDMPNKEAEDMSVELLRAVRIPSPELRVRDYPHQMSGGMMQRVMIAIAIACNPALLIADEPTTALDVTIEAQILELLAGLVESKKMSILLITHDLGILRENASRTAVMYAGTIMETSFVETLFDTPLHPYTRGLLGSLPKKRGVALTPIPGSVPKPELFPSGCRFSDRCSFVLDDCRAIEPTLREIAKGHFVRCIRAGEI